MADFTARNPTVKAEHVRLPNNARLHEELSTALAAGHAPGREHAVAGGHARTSALKRGLLQALDGYVKRDKLRPRDLLRERVPVLPVRGQDLRAPGGGHRGLVPALLQPRPLPRRRAGREQAPGDLGRGVALRRRAQQRGGDGKIERLGFEPGLNDAGIFNSPFAAWSATNGGKFATDDGKRLLFDTPQARSAALEWMQRRGAADRRARGLRRVLRPRNRAANDSFTIGQRSMYLTNHSFPARLKAGRPGPALRHRHRCPGAAPAGRAGHRPRGLVERHPGRRAGAARGLAADRSTSRPPGKAAGGSCRSRCAPRRSRR